MCMLSGWSGIAVACCLVVGKDPSLNEPLRQGRIEVCCAASRVLLKCLQFGFG